jgi:hypothetical protein
MAERISFQGMSTVDIQDSIIPFIRAPARAMFYFCFSSICSFDPTAWNCPTATPVVPASATPLNPGCLPPTLTSNTPGSTTRFAAVPIGESCRDESVKETVFFSPAFSCPHQNP